MNTGEKFKEILELEKGKEKLREEIAGMDKDQLELYHNVMKMCLLTILCKDVTPDQIIEAMQKVVDNLNQANKTSKTIANLSK